MIAKEIAVQRPCRYRKEVGGGGGGNKAGYAKGFKCVPVCVLGRGGGGHDYSIHVLRKPLHWLVESGLG